MTERVLSPAVRIIAGIVSVCLIVISLFVALSQVRAGLGSDLRAWAAALGLLIIALLGVRIFRAALRGSITLRERSSGGHAR